MGGVDFMCRRKPATSTAAVRSLDVVLKAGSVFAVSLPVDPIRVAGGGPRRMMDILAPCVPKNGTRKS